jgi:antitoxin MazE
MRAQLVRIGNSRGIVIPTAILKQVKITEGEGLEMEVKEGTILLSPVDNNPRKGWAEAFAIAVAEDGDVSDDEIIDIPNEFDKTEWTW